MKCCSKSTRWRVSALCVLGVLTLASGQSAARAEPAADAASREVVTAALERAVRQRLGGDATVEVVDLRILGQAPGASSDVLVVPDAAARVGAPSRFLLKWIASGGRARRYGEARATLRVEMTQHRLRHAVERGGILQPGDVERVRAGANGLELRPLPDQVIGAQVTRDLPAGTILTRSEIRSRALVRSGDLVVTAVKLDGASIRGTAIAAQDGRLGQTIRVVNPSSGRGLKAKVTGPGEVEVIHGV